MKLTVPTEDEFQSWKLHPVSMFIAEAYRIAAEKQRQAWDQQFDKPLFPGSSDFAFYRITLKTREDAYRSILENTLADYIAIVDPDAVRSKPVPTRNARAGAGY